MNVKKMAALAAAMALTLGVVSCGESSSADDTGSSSNAGSAASGASGAAEDSGDGGSVVNVYTHNEVDEMKALVADAEAATGLDINVLRLSSNEGWARVENEAPNFGADMQWGQLQSNALHGVDEDYFLPYDSPTWKDVPDKFKDPDGKWYGWSYWYDLIAVNTDILESKGLDKPSSWADLADPQYQGEIVMPDPGTSGTAYLMVSTILQIMGEDEGWKYFEKLNKNVGQYTKSGTQPAELVGQGEYAIGITWDQAVFNRIEEGYPMAAVLPEEGVGYSLDVAWIFKNAEHPEAAKTLLDYIGSDKGMESAAKVRSMVTKPGFQGDTEIEDLDSHMIEYDAVWADEHQDEIMKHWRDQFGSGAE